MGYLKLSLKPGIDKQNTEYGAEGGWTDCDNVRFRYGLPEKIGGWTEFQQTTATGTFLIGMASDAIAWKDLDGSPYLAVGTNRKLYVNYQEVYYDITPIRSENNSLANAFTTTSASTTVTVHDSGHGAIEGDFVTLSEVTDNPGGISNASLTGEFEIQEITNTNSYTIIAASAATSSVTTTGSATSAYQINVGRSINYADYGWGVGEWGVEEWGTPRSATGTGIVLNSRIWQFDTFGEDLLCQLQDGRIYRWDTSVGVNSRAVLVPNAPTKNRFALVTTDRHLVLFGSETTVGDASTFDPMLVRFSNREDISNYAITNETTAGDQRLTDGSKIISAIRSRNQILILTDTSLHGMQFVGDPFTFGFSQLGSNCGCAGSHAAVDVNGLAFWMGVEAFYVFDGTVKKMPCTVQDYVFDDINLDQKEKFFVGLNSQFNELTWWYCSSGEDQINRSVTYNYLENVWHINSSIHRTTWIDVGAYNNPIALEFFPNSNATYTISTINGLTQGRSLVYTHEEGTEANGSAMSCFLQSAYFDIADGDEVMFMRRFVPDFKDQVGNINVNLFLRSYPETTAINSSLDPYIVTPTTDKIDTRARGRQLSLKLQSSSAGSTWRYGTLRVDIQPDGRR